MMTPKRLERELEARLYGPHADEHTAAAASLAAACIRFLNYATGSAASAALEFPSTVYEVAADLKLAAARMPQLFTQMGDWLAAEDAAGMLGTDDGSPAAGTVLAARLDLAEAADAATALFAHLDALHNCLSGLNGRGPNRAERAA